MTNRSQDWSGNYLAKGRYKVIKKIGAGGHGCVYLADDTQRKRDVVIKVPHSQLLNVPGVRERFEREYLSLRELKHPNIVEIYEARESRYFDKTPYAVLQYLGGGDLSARMSRDPSNLLEWLPQIACALDYLHSMNHIHRDVKPSNILFDLKSNAFLADFGIVKALIADAGQVDDRRFGTLLDSDPVLINEEASRLMGTPGYMAPELFEKAGISPKVDQFSLAVIVYELIVGRRPFDENISGGMPADPARQNISLLSDVSPKFKEAVCRGLARNPNDRFPSCEAFAFAIVAPIQSIIGNKIHANTCRIIKCPSCRGTNQLPLDRQEEPFCCSHCDVSLISFGAQGESLIQRVWVYSVEGFRERGLLCAEKGYHLLAIADFTKAIHLGGDDAVLFYNRGLSYISIGKYLDAIEDFNTAITLNFRLKQAFEKRREACELLGDADFSGSINESISGRQDTQQIISDHKVPTRVIALVSRGTSHFASGELKDAIVILSEAIKQSPYFANPRVWRGRCYYELGDYSQAIADFTEAIRLEPDESLHHHWRGRSHYQSGEYSQAITDFTEAIRLEPSGSLHHHWRGRSYHELGDYSQAIADFTEAISLEPDQSWHYHWRGDSYHVLGDYSQAIADFTEAIRLDPNNPVLYELRGSSRDAQGYRDEAQIDIDTADRISKSVDDSRHENEAYSPHPNPLEPETIIVAADETLLEINQSLDKSNSLNAKYFYHCSNCMFTYESERTQSDKKSACPQCGKLPQSRIGGDQLDSSKEFFDTYQTAFDHYNGGRYQKAIGLLTKTIRMLPNVTAHDLSETPFYLLRGICYHEFGDSRRAISDLAESSRAGSEHYLWRAIFSEPSNPSDYALRGLGFFVKGESASAVCDFDMAIEKHLDELDLICGKGAIIRKGSQIDIHQRQLKIISQCHYGRGLCMGRLGSHEDAIVSLTLAITADQNSGDARSARGWSYFETGEYFKAERDFYLAVQRRYNDADALCGLGWIAHKRGDVEKAKRNFKEAESYGEFVLAKKWHNQDP